MVNKNTTRRAAVHCAVILLIIFACFLAHPCFPVAEAAVPATRSLLNEETATLEEIRTLLRNNYVDPIPEAVLQAASVEELLALLGDPHTSYLSPEAYRQLINSLDQSFTGIGIAIEADPLGVQIIAVFEGTPAAEAGLLPGDIITSAANTRLAGLSLEEAVTLLRGPAGSSVSIEVLRSNELIHFTLMRRQINIPSVRGELLESGIAYIRTTSFGSGADRLLGKELDRLGEAGATGWILDLRNNGGGYLSAAQGFLGYFAPGKTALIARNFNPWSEKTYAAFNHQPYPGGPVILLVNSYSASASEIVAAAMLDYEKALLLGSLTYGKGTMQYFYSLAEPPGSYLKMTTHRFFSPLGHSIDGIGVQPHLEPETAEAEAQHWNDSGGQGNATGTAKLQDPVLETARLLLSGLPLQQGAERRLDLQLFGQELAVDLEEARREDYWPLFYPAAATYGEEPRLLYYPRHQKISHLEKSREDFRLSVQFSRSPNLATLSGENIELVEEKTGRRLTVEIRTTGERTIEIIPLEPLVGSSYWLLLHQEIQDSGGRTLKAPAMAQITVN